MTIERKEISLRRRIYTGMATGLVIILVMIMAALWGYARHTANRSYDRLLASAALAIRERLVVTENGVSVDIPFSAMSILSQARDDRIFYHIYTQSGETITGEAALPVPDIWSDDDTDRWFFDEGYSGETVRFVLLRQLMVQMDRTEYVYVQIGQTRRARQALEQELIATGMIMFSLIALVGIFFVWLGINKAMFPLIGIERQLRLRDETDFSPIEESPPREVRSLVRSINSFILRLKRSLDNSQTFIADVAHQIRTSLSALQGQIELASGAGEAADQQHHLARAEQQAKRTIRLTNQLLAHAMVIHRGDKQAMQPVNLVALAKEELVLLIREQVSGDQEFGFYLDPPDRENMVIPGDPVSLRELLRNLLDNALKYGPPDNHIDIRMEADGAYISLIIDDAGPGVPAENRQEVFERFNMLSRSSGGTGVGLSIVKAVADRHGAKITLSESPYGGLRVTIRFAGEGGI